MPNPQRSSSPLNRANPDLSPATRHNPALGITAVAQPGFSRASRWTVSHRLSRPSPSCGARGSAAAEGRPESDPGPIVAAVEPDELELGGVTAFRPARRDRGRPASPRNGPEAVTELADVRDPRAAHIARSACRMVSGPGAGHGLHVWTSHCAPRLVLLPGSGAAQTATVPGLIVLANHSFGKNPARSCSTMRPVRPLLRATRRAAAAAGSRGHRTGHRIPALRMSWKCGLTTGLTTALDKVIPGAAATVRNQRACRHAGPCGRCGAPAHRSRSPQITPSGVIPGWCAERPGAATSLRCRPVPHQIPGTERTADQKRRRPTLIILPDGSPGGLGPAAGAGVVRRGAVSARYRRLVHGAAAWPPGGRRPDPALRRTGGLVPAPAAEATTGLP